MVWSLFVVGLVAPSSQSNTQPPVSPLPSDTSKFVNQRAPADEMLLDFSCPVRTTSGDSRCVEDTQEGG